MAEGVVFPFPSLPLNDGRTYGQPEVVLISLPQVATGLRLRLPLLTSRQAEERSRRKVLTCSRSSKTF